METPEQFLERVSPNDDYGIRADLKATRAYKQLLILMDRYAQQVSKNTERWQKFTTQMKHDDRQVEFTKQEMEWARKEFEVIDNFLSKRRAKYEKRMRGLDN